MLPNPRSQIHAVRRRTQKDDPPAQMPIRLGGDSANPLQVLTPHCYGFRLFCGYLEAIDMQMGGLGKLSGSNHAA